MDVGGQGNDVEEEGLGMNTKYMVHMNDNARNSNTS